LAENSKTHPHTRGNKAALPMMAYCRPAGTPFRDTIPGHHSSLSLQRASMA